jgi:hypothetical protein
MSLFGGTLLNLPFKRMKTLGLIALFVWGSQAL